MTGLPAFDSPKKSISWAREAIQELDAAFRDFFHGRPRGPILNAKPYGSVIDIDPDTGNEIHKFKLFETLPDTLSRKATEALLNARHSFDQAVYAACSATNKFPKDRKNTNFPWRDTPTDLDRTLEKRGMPTEFWDVIRREEPYFTGNTYSGGDDIIREIAKLANGKHEVVLSVIPRVSQYTHPSISGNIGPGTVIPTPRWDAVKNEMIMLIITPGANVQHDYSIQLQVVLNEPPPLGNIPAIALLQKFADRAEGFTKAIEAECMALVD